MTGETGSLSMLLVQKIHALSDKVVFHLCHSYDACLLHKDASSCLRNHYAHVSTQA